MQIKQYYLNCLSHASYMISDEKTKTAVIVDPQRDVDAYVKDAREQGVTIQDVILTHFHADFAAGHLELQKQTGASISLGGAARPGYAFTARKEGDEIAFGDTRLKVLETPGHTPEAISLVAYDLSKSADKPQAVLTGDTLFAGDVGRPDLAVATGQSKEELAAQLYDSLHQKLLTLPDETVVYPAHGPGSLCGSAGLAGKVSTIGKEKSGNPLLSAGKQEFVHQVLAGLGEAPAYFSHDAQLNQSLHPTLDEVMARARRPLDAQQIMKLQSEGAIILDSRSPDEFAAGHLPGSVNVGIDGRFAQWAATLNDPLHPLVVVAPPDRHEETIMRLARVGVENVLGYLEGPVPGALTVKQERIGAEELARQLQSDQAPYVLDVRTPEEYRKGHIAGSHSLPLSELPKRLQEVPADRPVVVQCQSGYRSSMATSLLARQGLTCVTDLMGGIAAWQKAGLPVTQA